MVEYLDRILPGMDGEVAKQFQRILSKQGFAVQARLEGHQGGTRRATARPSPSSPLPAAMPETIEADVVLVAIGRVPYTKGLGLDA